MNWLLVGAGDIAGKRVLPALAAAPGSRVAAICDLNAERAAALAAPHGAAVFTDYARALAEAEADAVYVATPVFLHAPQALAALAAGKHVLVEKPMALTHSEARQVVAAAARAGRARCGVAYFRRCSAKYAMARAMLARGEFGQVVLARLTFFSWFNPDPADPKYWRVIPAKSGGGPLADMGAHMFDLLIGLLGLPERVFARVATLTHPYAAEDSAALVMTLRGGAQALASFHWNSKTWSHEFEIVGTEAKLKWHPCDGESVVKTVGRTVTEVPTPNPPNVHAPLIAEFIRAAAEGRDPAVPASEGAKTNLLLDAVYRSAREGREVEVRA